MNIMRTLCVCFAMLCCMTTVAQGLEHPWKGKKVAYFGDSITDPKNKASKNKYWTYLQQWLRHYALRLCGERPSVERHSTPGRQVEDRA